MIAEVIGVTKPFTDFLSKLSNPVLSGLLLIIAAICVFMAFVNDHTFMKTAIIAWIVLP